MLAESSALSGQVNTVSFVGRTLTSHASRWRRNRQWQTQTGSSRRKRAARVSHKPQERRAFGRLCCHPRATAAGAARSGLRSSAFIGIVDLSMRYAKSLLCELLLKEDVLRRVQAVLANDATPFAGGPVLNQAVSVSGSRASEIRWIDSPELKTIFDPIIAD